MNVKNNLFIFQLSPGIHALIFLLWTSVTSCGYLQWGHICLFSVGFTTFYNLSFLHKTAVIVLFLTCGGLWISPCVSGLCCPVITNGPEIRFMLLQNMW